MQIEAFIHNEESNYDANALNFVAKLFQLPHELSTRVIHQIMMLFGTGVDLQIVSNVIA